MGIEQRIQKRIPFTQQILINNSIMVNGINISEGGLYVHTGRMFPAGSIVDVSIPFGTKQINFKARVQHCQECIGMGLEFIDLSPEQQTQLKELMAILETITPPSTKKKILVVDDNDVARRMNKSRLVLDGFAVVEANNGVEAAKILQTEQLDLAIIDLYMEPMDGFKLTALIRQMPQHKKIPIIVFSGRSNPEAYQGPGASKTAGR